MNIKGSKKTLLFVSYPLVCGGVERALLSVLSFLPKEKFDITLLLTEKAGDLLPEVPSYVNIQEVPLRPLDRYELKYGRVRTLIYCLTRFHLIHAIRMIVKRFKWFCSGRKGNYNFLVIRDMMTRVRMSKIEINYDFAFAYAGGMLTGSIVHDLIHAQKTAIWCHNENEIGLLKSDVYQELYEHFTYRFASEDLAKHINSCLRYNSPMFEILPLYVDIQSYKIKAMQGPGFSDCYDGLRILTVGRLSYQKGLDEAIRMAVRIRDAGVEFRWYVVGGGEEYENLRMQIEELNIAENFILLGQKTNPFPYISQCDIYAQPSRWEAFCLTVAEAKAFAKPIIVTDFIGARQQIREGDTGLIVPLNDYEGFTNGLIRLLNSKDDRERFSMNLEKTILNNVSDVKSKWLKFLE